MVKKKKNRLFLKNTRKTALPGWKLVVFLIACFFSNCKTELPPGKRDPSRCILKDVGDAADLVKNKPVDSNRMVIVQGIADPRNLLWREKKTKKIFYITRVMGTERKLYYLKQIEPHEKPKILAELTGHLIKWEKLPEERRVAIMNSLEKKYQIKVDPKITYVIDAQGKPEGCP